MPVRTALVAVDVQGTFADDFPGAGLPVPGSGGLVDDIRDYTIRWSDDAEVVLTSQDWHPEQLPEHMVEAVGDQPDFENKLFTRHGISGTPEAELHPRFASSDLRAVLTDQVKKGQTGAAFSAFEGTDADGRDLLGILESKGVDRVVVYGFELANCVSATALDAAHAGFETWVVPQLCSVLDPEHLAETLSTLERGGVRIAQPDQISRLLAEEESRRSS